MRHRDLKPDNVLETCLWIGALAAAAHHERAHLEDELGELAEKMLTRFRPRARA